MGRMISLSQRTKGKGFSLIEVMVAVVILATGLLALAALQGALARNSAEAKARGAVMAALTSRMSEIRQAPPSTGTTWTMSTAWVSTAATQAGTSDLQVVETIAAWRWSGTDYVTSVVTDPLSTFTRATLAANWTGADGAKSLTLSSDLSGNIYGLGDGYPDNDPKGSAAKLPIVRQSNPSNTAGVIPIVTGNQATAASNPQPIIEGADNNLRVGTSFDVLNYVPEGSVAKITKRFQTEVIKCRCQFGAGGYSVAGKAQWPAVWDGATYRVYAGTGNAAGVAANAGEDPDYVGGSKGPRKIVSRQQSEQCTECCRDHHDAADSDLEARYDPEASAIGKFNESSGVLTAASTGNYVAACRVVKVDGLWRTAADMYQRQYGLLETRSDDAGVQAKSGIPSDSATTAYQTFVKDYLKLYNESSTTAPLGAQTKFDEPARGLNNPATISIAEPTSGDGDWRYLHGRGLYVDYLTTKAQTAVGKAITNCPGDLAECILPVLPFTTINLTEMANWEASNSTVLEINTDKTLDWLPAEPFGGRTAGRAPGTATNTSAIRTSNSGVAVSDDLPGPVDDNGDAPPANDTQSFTVNGVTSPVGTDAFYVKIVGGALTSRPSYTSPAGAGTCTFQNAATGWRCTTQSTLPLGVTLILASYVEKDTASARMSTSGICTEGGNTYSVTDSITRPTFTNYAVTSAAVGAQAATAVNPSNNGKYNETTAVIFSSVAKDATIVLTLTAEGTPATTTATVWSCTTNAGHNQITNATWNKTWCPTLAGNPYTGCL